MIGESGSVCKLRAGKIGGRNPAQPSGNNIDLFAGRFDNDTVYRYGTDGTLKDTIALGQHVGVTGLDVFENMLFIAGYLTGDVYVFDMTGALLTTIDLGLGAGSLSGLTVDASDFTLWVATGFGDGRLLHYDITGHLLGNYDGADVQGLYLIKPSQDFYTQIANTTDGQQTTGPMQPMHVSEPANLAVFAAGLGLLGWWRRRRAPAKVRRR